VSGSVDTDRNAVPYGVAAYLAVVQFLFATCWTVYVVYLPQLAEAAGIPRDRVVWILLLDQAIFAVMDLAMGLAVDRVRRALGRIGPLVVGLTLFSCTAFLLMPHAGLAGPAAAVAGGALLVVWTVTSSALRGPPWLLLSRYATQPRLPWLAAVNLTGLAIGAGIAPYLGIVLRDADPRLPFAVASLVLALTASGLIVIERRLARDEEAPSAASGPIASTRPRADPAVSTFLAGMALLAIGFQLHVFVNAGPQYLRFTQPESLQYLLPVFWIGFNLAMFPGAGLAARFGTARVMTIAALAGTAAAGAAGFAPTLAVLIVAQTIAGGAWGCVLMAAFSAAMRYGHTGREGLMTGLLWSTLSAAALLRFALIGTQAHRTPAMAAALDWLPALLWFAGGVVLLTLGARSPQTAPEPGRRSA